MDKIQKDFLINFSIGGKLYSKNYEFFEEFGRIYDFIEVLIEPDVNLNALFEAVSLSKKPIRIHAAHQYFGFNPANPKKFEVSKKILEKAILAAEKFNCASIVVHPGFEEEGISLEKAKRNTIEFFRLYFDKRLAIENCPYYRVFESTRYSLSSPNDFKEIKKAVPINLTLDFSHAISTANCLSQEPLEFIKEFIGFKPALCHLSGIEMDSKKDAHLHLFEVENKFEYIALIKSLANLPPITLETKYRSPIEYHKRDVEILRALLR